MNGLVLIVEQDRATAGCVQTLLEQAGFRVEVAANAATAMERLKMITPVIVLGDMLARAPCGDCLARAVRRISRLERTRLVMFTAARDPEIVAHARHAGAADVVLKPIEAKTFARRMLALSRRPAPRAAQIEQAVLLD